jgi:2-oxoisovalerate dehydrogenase E1 component beta subunit
VTYRSELARAMETLAADRAVRFIGYGVKIGGRALGTLKNVADHQLVETPVAENLMVGLATGMSLAGLRPLVFIERMDFILNALDAIVNHLGAARKISRGQFHPAAILRVVIGNRHKPLYTGPTHTQDFTEAIRQMVDFPVVRLTDPDQIAPAYFEAHEALYAGRSTMLVEHKDMI